MRHFNSRIPCGAAALRPFDDENWLSAKRVARELDKVLDAAGPRREAVARAAGELRLSTRRIYALLARYQLERTVSSLLSRKSAARRKRLADDAEAIIAATLREQWLILEAPPLAPVVDEIRARCEAAGLRPPSYVAIRARAASLFSPEEVAKRRSANSNHLRRLKPRPGYISAPGPLAVTQIDHTPTDIQFVEIVDGAGAFVGRAYLTILVDVFSRCILGFCLTLEAPSTLSVALCLAHAICPKEAWLESRGVAHAWPTLGRPKQIVTDSAKEFRGAAFQRGCAEYGVSIRHRNRGCVHEGGVVERASRTTSEKIAITREIAAIVTAARATKTRARRSSKAEVRDKVRSTKAADAPKPHQLMKPVEPPAPHPARAKRLLPIESW